MKNDLASKEVKRLQRENMKQKFELTNLNNILEKITLRFLESMKWTMKKQMKLL